MGLSHERRMQRWARLSPAERQAGVDLVKLGTLEAVVRLSGRGTDQIRQRLRWCRWAMGIKPPVGVGDPYKPLRRTLESFFERHS